MTNIKSLIVPNNEEVREEAIQVIVENLGIAKAAFFIKNKLSQKIDYLELKEQLFGEMTAKGIYKEIEKTKLNDLS